MFVKLFVGFLLPAQQRFFLGIKTASSSLGSRRSAFLPPSGDAPGNETVIEPARRRLLGVAWAFASLEALPSLILMLVSF
jgi:hypothetical protein